MTRKAFSALWSHTSRPITILSSGFISVSSTPIFCPHSEHLPMIHQHLHHIFNKIPDFAFSVIHVRKELPIIRRLFYRHAHFHADYTAPRISKQKNQSREGREGKTVYFSIHPTVDTRDHAQPMAHATISTAFQVAYPGEPLSSTKSPPHTEGGELLPRRLGSKTNVETIKESSSML